MNNQSDGSFNPNGDHQNLSVDKITTQAVFTKEDYARLRNVRLQVIEGGIRGAIVGAMVGGIGYKVVEYFRMFPLPKQFGLPATMVGTACVCAYVGSVSYGKNAFVEVGDIIRKADRRNIDEEVENKKLSRYQGELLKNERAVLDNLDAGFDRRAEAIRQYKLAQTQIQKDRKSF